VFRAQPVDVSFCRSLSNALTCDERRLPPKLSLQNWPVLNGGPFSSPPQPTPHPRNALTTLPLRAARLVLGGANVAIPEMPLGCRQQPNSVPSRAGKLLSADCAKCIECPLKAGHRSRFARESERRSSTTCSSSGLMVEDITWL
jgi:hypothetical protein